MTRKAQGFSLALSFFFLLNSSVSRAAEVFKDFSAPFQSVQAAPPGSISDSPPLGSIEENLPHLNEAALPPNKNTAPNLLPREEALNFAGFFQQRIQKIKPWGLKVKKFFLRAGKGDSPLFVKEKGTVPFSCFFDGGGPSENLLPQNFPKTLDIPSDASEKTPSEIVFSPETEARQNLLGEEGEKEGFLAHPIELQVNPKDEFAVEKILREKIDLHKGSLGLSSSDLATVYVTAVAGAPHRADTIYAYFRQKKDVMSHFGNSMSLPVWGAYVAATIKVINGRAFLISLRSNLYDEVSLPQKPVLSDRDLNEAIRARYADSPETLIRFLGRAVIEYRGRWRAVNLYRKKGLPVAIAADLFDGDIFIWNNQGASSLGLPPDLIENAHRISATTNRNPLALNFRGETPKAEGQALGRAELSDHRPNGEILLSPQPLPFLHLTIDGRDYTTDENGRFSADLQSPQGTVKAKLSGLFTEVVNENGDAAEINGTLRRGPDNVLVFNPEGSDPLIVNQVNAYVADSRHRAWLRKRLNSDHRLDYRTTIRVNSPEFGNAWYSAESGDIHSDRESEEYSDTGRIGVFFHEMTHKADDMIHNPPSGFFMSLFKRARAYFSYSYKLPVLDHPVGMRSDEGLNEGWGDTVLMFMLDTPLIGEGFYKKQNPSWIRSGENDYQFNPQDEVHEQGLAWMGFAWDLRKSLSERLGKEEGAALAEELVIPILLGYIPDIPSAMAHALLNAMDKNGNILHEELIRSAAQKHGIKLPPTPSLPL